MSPEVSGNVKRKVNAELQIPDYQLSSIRTVFSPSLCAFDLHVSETRSLSSSCRAWRLDFRVLSRPSSLAGVRPRTRGGPGDNQEASVVVGGLIEGVPKDARDSRGGGQWEGSTDNLTYANHKTARYPRGGNAATTPITPTTPNTDHPTTRPRRIQPPAEHAPQHAARGTEPVSSQRYRCLLTSVPPSSRADSLVSSLPAKR